MTKQQATKEAIRRWGYQARAEMEFDCGADFYVSSRYRNHFGKSSRSFENAFLDADRRDNLSATSVAASDTGNKVSE